MTLNLVPPPTQQCISPERIVGLPSTWIICLCPKAISLAKSLVVAHLQADLTTGKKTHDATWQSWRSWLLQVALSKAGRIYLESLQHCYDLCEKTLGIMDLALGTDMCSTVTTCTFFSLRVHMGSMSSLETNAEWVAKMTMLNSQDFSHNVHIYTALQKDQAAWLC